MDEPLNVENIFEKELKAPFTYNLHLDLVDTNDKLFELINFRERISHIIWGWYKY